MMCKGGRFVLLFGVVVLLLLFEDSFLSYGIREVFLVVLGQELVGFVLEGDVYIFMGCVGGFDF